MGRATSGAANTLLGLVYLTNDQMAQAETALRRVVESGRYTLVADYADGWNAAYLSPEEFSRVNDVLNEWCEEEQRDPRSLKRAANVMFNLGLDEKDIVRQREQLDADWGPMAERTAQGALLCKPGQAVDYLRRAAAAAPWATLLGMSLGPWAAPAMKTPSVIVATGSSFGCFSMNQPLALQDMPKRRATSFAS